MLIASLIAFVYFRADLRTLAVYFVFLIFYVLVPGTLIMDNLGHNYLTFLLANDENAYSTECEIVGEIEGSINQIALHDFEIFRELFGYDFFKMEKALEVHCFDMLMNYQNVKGHGKVFNKRIRDRICELSVKLAKCEDASERFCLSR